MVLPPSTRRSGHCRYRAWRCRRASGFAPSPAAKMDGVGARLVGLTEEDQSIDPIEDGKAGDAAGRSECPRRANAELARGHAGLDNLANRKLRTDWIEHDSSPVHHAEHAAADLGAGSIESDALDCRHGSVVDRAKCRD